MSDILEWTTPVALTLEEESEVAVNWPAAVALNTGPLEWDTLVQLTLAEEVPL